MSQKIFQLDIFIIKNKKLQEINKFLAMYVDGFM
jgi:hypothetical protein